MSDVKCSERMSELLESQAPVWGPGTKSGYHTLTIGFLIDQLARRIDPNGRGIAQLFREEVKNSNGHFLKLLFLHTQFPTFEHQINSRKANENIQK
jgi:hypothetical protein